MNYHLSRQLRQVHSKTITVKRKELYTFKIDLLLWIFIYPPLHQSLCWLLQLVEAKEGDVSAAANLATANVAVADMEAAVTNVAEGRVRRVSAFNLKQKLHS